MSDEKLIEHNITVGGAHLLKSLLNQQHWYEGNNEATTILIATSDLLVEDLASKELAPPEAPAEIKGHSPQKPAPTSVIEAYNTVYDEWAKQPLVFKVSDTKRDAIKLCLSFALKKAVLFPTIHVAKLLKEFGVR